MKVAIVSDVHSNLEALVAVLADIQQQGITTILNLGDLIGYGPNPVECLKISELFALNLIGNHEEVALGWAEDPTKYAGDIYFGEGHMSWKRGGPQGIYWFFRQAYGDSTPIEEKKTRAHTTTYDLMKLMSEPADVTPVNKERGDKVIAGLKRLKQQAHPYSRQVGPVLFTHGGGVHPELFQYPVDFKKFPHWRKNEMAYPYQLMLKECQKKFKGQIKFVYGGHTHHPGIYEENGIVYVNPGSVGEPRDGEQIDANGEPLASFAVHDTDLRGPEAVELCSVPYDWETTHEKKVAAGLLTRKAA